MILNDKETLGMKHKYSYDDIVNAVSEHAINLFFYPSSESYEKYGGFLTIIDLSEEEKSNLRLHLFQNRELLDSIKVVVMSDLEEALENSLKEKSNVNYEYKKEVVIKLDDVSDIE